MKAELSLDENPFLKAANRINNSVERMEKGFAAFSVKMMGIKLIGEMVAAQFEKVRESFNLGGELSDVSEATGQAVGDLVIIRQAFQNAGLGADDVGGKLNKLQKALSGLNEDGDKTDKVLNQLGTSVEELAGMSAIKQIETLQKGFAGVSLQADRLLLTTKLFGKTGGNMAALFNDKGAIKFARQQAGGLAETMQRNAATFDRLSDSLDGVTVKFQQFWAGVAEGIAPTLEGVAKAMVEMDFSDLGRSVGKAAAALIELARLMKQMIPIIAGLAANLLFTRVSAALPVLLSVARLSFGGIAAAGVNAARAIMAAFGPVGIAVAIATAGFMAVQSKTAKINRTSAAISEIGGERSADGKETAEGIKHLKSEDAREKMATGLAEKLAEVQKRIQGVNQEFADLGQESQDAIKNALEAWAQQITNYQRILGKAALNPGAPKPLFEGTDKTPVSSRQRAAGGGWARAGDPAASEARRHTALLTQIRDRLPGGTAQTPTRPLTPLTNV